MSNFKKLMTRMTAVAVGFGLSLSNLPVWEVQAASEGTATLRIISTTDLHGQSITTNYDNASEHPQGSLAQVSTLIKEAKESLTNSETMLVDIGDTVYGFGSDSIMNGAITGSEYMYAEMAKMGYDAITVGNHDFDYGYEYIKEALKETNLNSKALVANVYAAKTRNPVWKQNRVITKTLTTTKGIKKQVRIGVFGVTDPILSSHFDHTGLLVTKDIVESAKEQVAALKAQNVDVIVAMAHSGIGNEQYEVMASDAVYEMSKLDGIDVILMGDDHVNFPSEDASVSKFYDYEDVAEDGKINGKVVVGVADHGVGIGIADLKLQFTDGKVSLVSSKGYLEMVTPETQPDPMIVKANKEFQKQIDAIYNESLGKVSSSINNFFAMLEDNAAIQAANESKIQYGLEYINQYAPEYKEYPVVACTDYKMVGQDSANNYIHIDGDFTVADSLNVQDWNRDCTSIYWLTGAQLREWIEWRTASAYQTPDQADDVYWDDELVLKQAEENGLIPINDDAWLGNWANYHVFDGVEYEIDVTQPARYSKTGKLKNKASHRVTSLTCNGVPVKDDQKFAIVCAQVTSTTPVISKLTNQKILRGNMSRGYNNIVLQNYVRQQSALGALNVKADDNWKIKIPEGTNYLVKAAAESELLARSKEWYIRTVDTDGLSNYYQAKFGQEAADTSGPLLVLGLGNSKRTNHNVTVVAEASDVSKVTELKYFPGVIDETSASWNGASSILSTGSFEVTGNGTYSVRAKDSRGNMTVKYITVSNMDASILEAPDVDKYTNRKRQITGKADPGLRVFIKAEGQTYETVTDEKGAFSYDLPMQNADSVIRVWVEDAEGKKSEKVDVIVARTGANEPTVYNITNKLREISGTINDSKYCKVVAIADNVVYVDKNGGKENYLTSNIYNEKYSIMETDFSINSGEFKLTIPVFNANTKVKVYSMDWIGRASVVTEFVTEDVAPNMPRYTQTVYALDDCVYGKIPAPKTGVEYTVSVSDGSEEYTAVADEDGSFVVQVGALQEGQQISVAAIDEVNGKLRESTREYATVASYQAILTPYTLISFDEINSKGTLISGHIGEYTGKLNLLIGTTRVTVMTDEEGNFSYTLSDPRPADTPIVAMARDEDGSVWDICETTVRLALPDAPEMLEEVIYDTTQEIRLFCTDRATAVVKIGTKYYKAETGVYDQELGGYVYTITLKKAPKAEKPVIIYMMNAAGKSEKLKTVVEKDPTVETDPAVETEGNTEDGQRTVPEE